MRVGDQAPDFRLQDPSGATVELSALRGGPVVVFFYPATRPPAAEACLSRSVRGVRGGGCPGHRDLE